MLGIRKCTMPRVASCARIRHFCWHHHMHPVLHGLGSPNAYGCKLSPPPPPPPPMHTGCKLRPPWCTRGANWGPPNAHGMQTEAPLMHTGCKLRPPWCTRGADWAPPPPPPPPDAHGMQTEAPLMYTGCWLRQSFSWVSQSWEQTE